VRVEAGYGFVEVSGEARDVLVPRGMEGAALHGDGVEVEIDRREPRTGRPVGRVVSVVRPLHRRIVGVLERTREGWCAIPRGGLLPPFRIVGDTSPRPSDAGRIGLVRVTAAPAPGRWPAGELERVLGQPDDLEVQVLTVALEYGLAVDFPADVADEAERLPTDPSPVDFEGRRDLRALPFVTIDGETARDFDDAVHVERAGTGWRAWVAIADVAHYVRPGSALDREAARRGTSVYFPDRALPMLPERLSAELCSLRPGRLRLAIVVEMTFDARGRRTDASVHRGVIASTARLTYTHVAAVLAGEPGPERAAFETLRSLMRVLLRRRTAGGALDLDLPEAVIDLSAEGRAVGVRLLDRTDAHRVIEELMLEANQAVAAFLERHEVPFPYRIHEPPLPADVAALDASLAPFGFGLGRHHEIQPKVVQGLLRELAGHPLARVLTRLVLRSLRQARYHTTNAGHFGLAFRSYCHFTSPIRRYPDLLVHRQVGRVLEGEVERARRESERLEGASLASSTAERVAMEAERAMIDLKKAEFIQARVGEPFSGTIVAVVRFGFFVELDPWPIEGLVKVDTLTDDHYRFLEAEGVLVGVRRRRRFRLGDRVAVAVTAVSLGRREIDLALVGAPERRPGASRRHAGRSPGRRRPS